MTGSVIKWLSRSAFLAIMAFVVAFAVACSDGDDGGTTGSTTGDPSATSDADSTSGSTGTTESGLSGSLTIFAASSLTDAFTELGDAFMEANPETDIEFNFAGSAGLRAQLEQGARADVFASANQTQMDAALEAEAVADAGEIFVRNSLVIITPDENLAGITDPAGLAEPGIKLVLAAPEVPVGGYARQAIENMATDSTYGESFSEDVLDNLVSNESNVRQVVGKVELGEADAGIVYGTAVTDDVADALNVIEIPNEFNITAEYPIALTSEPDNPEVAQAFVDFVLSPGGQAILEGYRFRTAG